MFPRSDLLPIQAAFQMVRLWWAMPSLEEKSRHWIDEDQTASLEMLFHDGLRTIICTRLASNRILTALFHRDKCKHPFPKVKRTDNPSSNQVEAKFRFEP